MTRASAAMASGDFTVRADESRDDEIGQLGEALNHLSTQLQQNISNLILGEKPLVCYFRWAFAGGSWEPLWKPIIR
ncbi:MAG: HAMP domain-containing protein [Eubacteriales bacterium]